MTPPPQPPQNYQRYGVPLFSTSWVPHNAAVRSADVKPADDLLDHLVLGGGGGEGNSGIPNALLLTEFNRDANSLSLEPVRHSTGTEIPYRMAVHPRGDGLICSFPNSCRWFDWENAEDGKIGLRASDRVLTQLEDVGLQLALAFSEDGSLLAVGGEDGKLRVFKWPSMEIVLNEGEPKSSVKDLHFSTDGRYLVSLGSNVPCRLWDVTTSKVVATLAKEAGEVFRFCRFSQSNDRDQVLYCIAQTDKGASIISWSTSSWKRVASKQIRDSASAFDVSIDGKRFAIGTNEGNILILDASNMRVHMTVKKAHLGLVTALAFSRDSRALGSVSMDASVRATVIPDKSSNGFNYWIIVLIIILALAVYFLKSNGLIPESLPFH